MLLPLYRAKAHCFLFIMCRYVYILFKKKIHCVKHFMLKKAYNIYNQRGTPQERKREIKMKKFKVENAIRTAEMIEATEHTDITDNYVGDYIEADTAEEAIDLAMDFLAEQSGCNTVMTGDSVLVYNDDDEIVAEYYRFVATEIA